MSKLQSGDQLELNVASFFQARGFFVRRGVKLSASAIEGDATDIDVLAIRSSPVFAEERTVVDCKDRDRARPYQRILWARGLAAFIRASRCVVVLRETQAPAREFAAQGDVELASANLLSNSQYKGYSDADIRRAQSYAAVRTIKAPASKELLRTLAIVRQMLVVGNSAANFNRLTAIVRKLEEQPIQSLPELQWAKAAIIREAAVISAILVLRIVGEVKWFSEPDLATGVVQRLTYGDLPIAKAQQLARVVLKEDLPDGLPPPEYADEIASHIAALVGQPGVAQWLPQAVDQVLFPPNSIMTLPLVSLEVANEARMLALKHISAFSFACGLSGRLDPLPPLFFGERATALVEQKKRRKGEASSPELPLSPTPSGKSS